MENIVSILSGLGVEIPQELVPALHKEIAENYKTVAEFQKLRKQLDRLKSGLPDTAASYSKLMIASNGRQSAVLLDGVMIGVGVGGILPALMWSDSVPEPKRTSSAFAPDRQGTNWVENDAGSSDFKKERGTYAARKRNLPA